MEVIGKNLVQTIPLFKMIDKDLDINNNYNLGNRTANWNFPRRSL